MKVRENVSSRRASSKGCVLMSLAEYLELPDWTRRQVYPGKRGLVSRYVPPIPDRLNLVMRHDQKEGLAVSFRK